MHVQASKQASKASKQASSKQANTPASKASSWLHLFQLSYFETALQLLLALGLLVFI
jgi:hypothetical protein